MVCGHAEQAAEEGHQQWLSCRDVLSAYRPAPIIIIIIMVMIIMMIIMMMIIIITPSTDSIILPKDMYADWHYSLGNRFAQQVNPA